ncbi:MAG: hypothetical protein R3335_00810 [Anaerolineales bacterium]|nr:hypothetical protein [Anaerolineales bacterium]
MEGAASHPEETKFRQKPLSLANAREAVLVRSTLHHLLLAIGLFAFFAGFLALVQHSTLNLIGTDGYYHIKLAYLMRTVGLKPDFPWLPLTVLNPQDFVDHHFLYHVFLIPFTLGDLRVGAKLASVIFPALAFVLVWWLLQRQKVPYAWLWALFLVVISEAFIYRMSMPRAQSLSLAFLVLGLHWLFAEKYIRLIPLAFLYVWLYDAFPLLAVVAGLYALSVWLTERRLVWQPLVYTAAGIGLGLLVNPYFPENLTFIYHHLIPKLAGPTETSVGSEWYPYRTTQLMENSGLALVALVGGILALGFQERRIDARTLTGLLLVILFGVMLFQSRRFIEYFPPFALIFSAMAWAPIIQSWRVSGEGRLPMSVWLRAWLPAAALILVLGITLLPNLKAAQDSVEGARPYQRYAEAAGWLQANSKPGEGVFQTDWDDFTRLFFHNSQNTYTLGLDPTYLQNYDSEKYDLWVDITRGDVDRPAATIAESFGAGFVFTDLEHDGFLEAAEADPGLVEVYRDQEAAIFAVQPGQGEQ